MNWQDILKLAGFPTTVVILDFESYYDNECSLSKLSILEYITHPKFELFGIGVDEIKQPFQEPHSVFWTKGCFKNRIRRLQEEYGQNLERCTIVGQNLKFDGMILTYFFGIVPEYTVDILDLSRFYDSRRKNNLANLCKIYKTSVQKGDTAQFKGKKFDEIDINKLTEYNRNDMIAETELLCSLLPGLGDCAKIELPLQTHTLKMYLRPYFEFDYKLAGELVGAMATELDLTIHDASWIIKYSRQSLIETIRSNKLFVEILQKELPQGEIIPMKVGKKNNIPQLAKTDAGFQYLLEHPVQKVRELCQARLASKSWPSHIKRINSMAAQAEKRKGKLGIPLNYYAGHLGRWGGTEGINLQNLAGSGRGGQGPHPLLQQMRHLLVAPAGFTLGIVDLAQIEARIVAWFAGQQDLLNGFAKGEDIYSAFATILFGHPVKKSDDKQMKIERGFGKDAILGCGYGMGALKFCDRCRANPDLRPFFDSGEYDFNFVQKLIKGYRQTYSKIPEFWGNIEKAFRWVVKYPQEIVDLSQLKLWNDNGAVNLQLPSGRILFYPRASINKDNKISWRWGKLWGGSLTENVVQATARDLFAEAILHIEDAGFPVIHHSHDEVVVCLNTEDKPGLGETDEHVALSSIIEIMCVLPTWATGLPVNAEGELTKFYKK